MTPIRVLPLACGAALIAGCATMPDNDDDGPMAGQCNAGPGQALIGQRASADTGARSLSLTGARTLRWGPPDSAFTMDYSPDRVNVMYDRQMRITAVTCG